MPKYMYTANAERFGDVKPVEIEQYHIDSINIDVLPLKKENIDDKCPSVSQ